VIFVDTSVLVDSLGGTQSLLGAFREKVERGERVVVSSIVLYEWLRGPRFPQELRLQEETFPNNFVVPFGPEEAAVAALLYRKVQRPRGREIDLMIAACAIRREADLWTLNVTDFKDIPGLRLLR
jgi:predicted nucleic acid-binding protein